MESIYPVKIRPDQRVGDPPDPPRPDPTLKIEDLGSLFFSLTRPDPQHEGTRSK